MKHSIYLFHTYLAAKTVYKIIENFRKNSLTSIFTSVYFYFEVSQTEYSIYCPVHHGVGLRSELGQVESGQRTETVSELVV
jgi:hypothetical protein